MSFKIKKSRKILLSILTAGISSGASASYLWDCVQIDGDWRCNANPNFTEATTPEAIRSPVIDSAASEQNIQQPSGRAISVEKVTAPPVAVKQVAQETATTTTEATSANRTAEQPVEISASDSQAYSKNNRTTEVKITNETPQPTPEPTKAVQTAEPARPEDSSAELDWVNFAPIDAKDLVCKGRYVEPSIWNGVLAQTDTQQAPLYIDADQSSSELGGITTLRGNIVMRQPGRQIESEYGEFDSQNEQAILRTNVRYREPGFLVTSNALSADLRTDTAITNEARYVLHDQHLRGEALAMTRYADQRIESQQSYATFCEPGNDDWGIRSQTMSLYPAEGYGEAWHTRFEVAGVPVFYLPYFYFPLDDTRRTGFLYPSFSSNSTNGLDLAIPYYFNIAPNVDDTLTARIIENRGLMLENEFRYLNRFSMNQLNASYLNSDNLTSEDRWLVNLEHQGNPAPRWTTNVDFTRVSDNNYFDDLTPVNLQVPTATDLNQRASVSYAGSTYTASALVNDYQTIDGGTSPYTRIPQLTLKGYQSLSGFQLGYQVQYSDFQHDSLVDGKRVHLRPSVSYDLNRPWGYIKPEAGVWSSSYELSNGTSPSRIAGFGSLDSGLIFERQGELGTQTLEPRIKLLSVDGDGTDTLLPDQTFFDSGALGFSYTNLFDNFGYAGNDQIAKTQQATVGLQSRIFSLSGREVFHAGIAQAHYLNSSHDPRPGDASGTANQSTLAITAAWRPTETLQIHHDSRMDETDASLLTQNYRLFYYPDSSRMLYTSLRIDEADPANVSRQIDIAGRWPLTNAWSVIGRVTEDLKADENLETRIGAEYQSCCWKVRLTAQRAVIDSSTDFTRENSFYLQFVLRGLGSLGQSEGRQFLEDLTGFNEDKNENF